MAKKKEKEVVDVPLALNASNEVGSDRVATVQPITQEFGNGDLNLLRDKLNEIISRL